MQLLISISMRVLLALLATVSVTLASQACANNACAPQNVVADFVFMIDASNAFEPDEFEDIKNFLRSFTSLIKIRADASQVAFYTYGTRPTSAGYLKNLNTDDAVATAIQNLKYQSGSDRMLNNALSLEESEVTTANGLRSSAEKILVLIPGDAWTGASVFSNYLDGARDKYDAIMVLGVGVQPIDNAFNDLRKFTANDDDIFFALNSDQLQYAGLWLANSACPNAHVPPTTPAPTVIPDAPASIGCSLKTIDTDIYLIVDASSSMPAADFAALKQNLYDLVAVFPNLGPGNAQFGLVITYSDTQLYFTGYNQGGTTRADLLRTIELLQQEKDNGQTLKLSLQAVEAKYLKLSHAATKLAVYFTGNTNFDVDPMSYVSTLNTQYNLKTLAVRWTNTADSSELSKFTGGPNCVFDALTSSARSDVNRLIETDLCKSSYCR